MNLIETDSFFFASLSFNEMLLRSSRSFPELFSFFKISCRSFFSIEELYELAFLDDTKVLSFSKPFFHFLGYNLIASSVAENVEQQNFCNFKDIHK